jgi:hypothetical protein
MTELETDTALLKLPPVFGGADLFRHNSLTG